ncbi:HAMP domain-containing histidine kinase [candidate division KSB1 bacterium]|nr:HAMP domain-containing histidine kinase [candidate division KSB1 bacterium]
MSRFFSIKKSIGPRLIFLFVIQVVIILLIAGFSLQWQLRNKLEAELGKHLEIVAGLVGLQIEGEILINLAPGDETTRSYQSLIRLLHNIQNKTAVRRIYLFNSNFQSLGDIQTGIAIGQEYIQLKFDQTEVTQVFSGKTASSVLFEGDDGRLYKSAYSPIWLNDKIVAAVRVEGSAQTLEVIQDVRKNLINLGILAVFGAIILAILFSRQIIRPLKQLQNSAQEIGRGNYQHVIKPGSPDEVGFLARTLEEMRKNIIQRDHQQKAMLAGVAHEIRNPLGGIELFAGILMDELPTGETQERALKILKEVKNLKGIVQDFLDYARPAEPQRKICGFKEILNETISFLASELEGIQIQDKQVQDVQVLFDPRHLKQILMNLMKNAIQAMPGGGIINLQLKPGGDNKIAFFFSDTGKGIPLEIQDKIFDPFFTTREKGVGLGLAIVKNLIEANGGYIELSKNHSPGTAFVIEMPGG